MSEAQGDGRRVVVRGVRAALAARAQEVRATIVPITQTAVAAGIAWTLAHDVIGHPAPFFAPIAASIVLGLAPGRRGPRAVEMVLGVAVGIGIGDLLIAAIGSGAVQIAVVVLLAMVAAVLLGGGPLLASQAAGSAVLVAALPSSHGIPSRFVDALVGGFVGLAILVAVPRNPVTSVRRATSPLFNELASVLDQVADALAAHDPARAERALTRARATSELAGRFRQTLELARETTRLSPTHWRSRGEIERYVEASTHVDYAVRNVRVLARAAVTTVEAETRVPAALPDAVRDLATGVRDLDRELEQSRGGAEGIETVLRAAGRATLVLDESSPLPVSVMVGQIRSTAVDLLRALGVNRPDAVKHVRAAARALRSEQRSATVAPPAGEQR